MERAILAGDESTGVTLMVLDEGLDTGPVLAVEATPISPDENRVELTDRLATLGAGLLADTLPGFLAGEIRPEPQAEDGVTVASRLDQRDRWLDTGWIGGGPTAKDSGHGATAGRICHYRREPDPDPRGRVRSWNPTHQPGR